MESHSILEKKSTIQKTKIVRDVDSVKQTFTPLKASGR